MAFLPYLHRVAARENLTAEASREAMSLILSGQASTLEIAAFLTALKVKGETADEILGLAQAMREVAAAVDAGEDSSPLIDTCGTGGDYSGTFNISTVSAFVVAGAGVRVAKHGNRSLSGKCGSADLMEALGVRIALTPEQMGLSIRETGIGFLFAPAIHASTKYAQPARAELKMRTAFNLLGPLTNPAGATVQLAGAPSREAAELMAHALAKLGMKRGFVVHGSDGLDEITTTGPTVIYEVDGEEIRETKWSPADFGVGVARRSDLQGGDPAVNREIALAVLSGASGPQRDIVLVNSAAALVAAGKATSLLEAMGVAAKSIDCGAARSALDRLVEFTNRVS